jgi:hypothetical protein
MNRRLLVSALALLVAYTIMGCGTPAAPEPPSLGLPPPVLNLSAVRIGDSVRLAWTMPSRTTDHIAIKHPVIVQVCRAVESSPCAEIASLNLPPGGAGAYTDALPSDLTRNPDRLLRYELELRNHAGKSAGPSNTAYSAAGDSSAAVTGFTGQVRRDGVLLSWKPEASATDRPCNRRDSQVSARSRRTACRADARDPRNGRRRPRSRHGHLGSLQPAIPLCARAGRYAPAFRAIG